MTAVRAERVKLRSDHLARFVTVRSAVSGVKQSIGKRRARKWIAGISASAAFRAMTAVLMIGFALII
jgi:hypothetical protein